MCTGAAWKTTQDVVGGDAFRFDLISYMLRDLAQQRPLGGFMQVQAVRGTMQRRGMKVMVFD